MKVDPAELAASVRAWGRDLGFQRIGIAGIDLPEDERHLRDWLSADRHGTMSWMARHGTRRSRPAELVPGTLRVISARMGAIAFFLNPGSKEKTEIIDAVQHDLSRFLSPQEIFLFSSKDFKDIFDALKAVFSSFKDETFFLSAKRKKDRVGRE